MCLVLLVTKCSSLDFSFPGEITYSPWCGRWSVTGTVTVSSDEIRDYGSKVTLQTTTGQWDEDRAITITRVCVVDLTKSPPLTQGVGDVCHVISRSGDVYTINASRQMKTSDGGLTLQAMLTSQSGDIGTFVTKTIGHLPEASMVTAIAEAELTYQIDDSEVRNIGHGDYVNVTVDINTCVPVRFCATNPPDGSLLKIFAKGQETKSQQSCVEAIYRFESSVNEIKFEYADPVCFHSETATLIVTEHITPANACLRRPGSKAREMRAMSNGDDVMCDTETDGGNWILFQRRNSSDVNFYQGWQNYTNGFGHLTGNFWLGLDKIHSYCSKVGECQLRVDLEFSGKKYHATYDDFYLDGPAEKFTLHVGAYSGDAGDVLTTTGNGHKFSTKDSDNDKNSGHCAITYTGAWWYDSCHAANLNGVWGSHSYGMGLNWHPTTGYYASVTLSEMKLKIIP